VPSFSKVYLGDYSNEGYGDGVSDGKEHRPKNRFKFFKVANPVNYVWNFDNAWESYQRHYDKGYIDGERVRHDVFGNTTYKTKGGNMSQFDIKYYEDAIAFLRESKRVLENIKAEIDMRMKDYNDHIDYAQSQNWMMNFIDKLRDKYAALESRSKKLQMDIGVMQELIDQSIVRLNELIAVSNQTT